jgi:hypothetical protein
MAEVDATLALIGTDGPTHGCTYYTSQIGELADLHSRDITFAVFSQAATSPTKVSMRRRPMESVRYRDFMGWSLPWYSAHPSLDPLLVGTAPRNGGTRTSNSPRMTCCSTWTGSAGSGRRFGLGLGLGRESAAQPGQR